MKNIMMLFNVKREKYLEGPVVFLELYKLHYEMTYRQWYSIKSTTKNNCAATGGLGFRTVIDIFTT